MVDSAVGTGGTSALITAQQSGSARQRDTSSRVPATEAVAAVQPCEVGVQTADLGVAARRQLSAGSDLTARLLCGTVEARRQQIPVARTDAADRRRVARISLGRRALVTDPGGHLRGAYTTSMPARTSASANGRP